MSTCPILKVQYISLHKSEVLTIVKYSESFLTKFALKVTFGEYSLEAHFPQGLFKLLEIGSSILRDMPDFLQAYN